MNDWSIGRSIAPPDDGSPTTTDEQLAQDIRAVSQIKPGPKKNKARGPSKEIIVRIPPDLMARMQHAIEMKQFPNRSELVREALFQFFFPVSKAVPTVEPIHSSVWTVSLEQFNKNSQQVVIGNLIFTKQQPGFIRRKLLKWLLGVEVRG